MSLVMRLSPPILAAIAVLALPVFTAPAGASAPPRAPVASASDYEDQADPFAEALWQERCEDHEQWQSGQQQEHVGDERQEVVDPPAEVGRCEADEKADECRQNSDGEADEKR